MLISSPIVSQKLFERYVEWQRLFQKGYVAFPQKTLGKKITLYQSYLILKICEQSITSAVNFTNEQYLQV